MTVSQTIRAEILALDKKVLMALALCCYLVMKIETQPLPPFAREVILQQSNTEKHSCYWARVPNTETSH